MIRKIQGSRWFTFIDLKDADWSVEIQEDHKKKTAFKFKGKVYEWNSMVMDFKNSVHTMQRIMQKVLINCIDGYAMVYLDDILLFC